ncbi:CRISPR-associated helicase Cas3' [Aquibium sp. A9E412]|nr:CRISPR-associated helicase Cas3' [Aquibium sp. A9E412]MDN2565202.1 CRISPR-associated helicase Cas3' [Aquibium sp. A9E412]
MERCLTWPGKSADPCSGILHPAVYHMLDVGVVADRLLDAAEFPRPLHHALALLAALHDLGKIGDRFRAMIEHGATQGDRHWQVSMAWFAHFDGDLLGPLLGGDVQLRFQLYAAAAGHHGGPPEPADMHGGANRKRMVRDAGARAETDARHVIEGIAALWPDASLDALRFDLEDAGGDWRCSAPALSRWFTGLVSLADWVGSNTEWFPASTAGPDMADYVAIARSRADIALRESGLRGASPSRRAAASLFAFDAFSPMQRAALAADLPDGQTLAVIEDATGSGKTEAALMLAQRMMQAGKGDGLFFALPTMATANAMFTRLTALGAMFDGQPSLALAHGSARWHRGFRALTGRTAGESDAISCADWFADGRRKALLAHIGVGTIDQALLAVLPTRYYALRLYALSRRILVVDEAHDYGNPYMRTQLERLLTFHAMLGGSAIVMTATLPADMRSRFVAAFQRGASRPPPPAVPDAYPQLAVIGEAARSSAVEPAAATVRRVAVDRVDTLAAALDILTDAAQRGAACAFVRNSVDEAIAAVAGLRERGVEAMLHHARFALRDRLANEDEVLATFGKQSSPEARRGQVIVSTQVLEQSLDLCFDMMVSDLAPMGALIQRAGRLWRHKRPRPVDGPVLHVLSPDPQNVTDENWSRDLLGQGWYVYPAPVQWRTARALFAAGCIDAPDGLRPLIEAVEGASAPAAPPALERAEEERLGTGEAERAQAAQNVLNPEKSYFDDQQVFSDEKFPTRLGPEQVTLVLARRGTDGRLKPWAPVDDGDVARAWALSEVSLAKRRWEQTGGVDQSTPEIAAIRKDWKMWKEGRYFLCPVGEDGILCNAVKYNEKEGILLAS